MSELQTQTLKYAKSLNELGQKDVQISKLKSVIDSQKRQIETLKSELAIALQWRCNMTEHVYIEAATQNRTAKICGYGLIPEELVYAEEDGQLWIDDSEFYDECYSKTATTDEAAPF